MSNPFFKNKGPFSIEKLLKSAEINNEGKFNKSDVLDITTEKYAVNDSTDAYSNILYMNDLNNIGSIYKYNINLSTFVDTISVNGQVLDIAFKN